MATIIFKPTEACNSNCAYCDVVARKDASKTMSFEMLEIVYSRVNEYLNKSKKREMNIIIHGGEPLVLGKDYFLKIIETINVFCKNTKDRIKHSIQTNLTLMSRDFIDIFKKLRINSVGTSFDPCPNMRGPGAKIDSNAYNKLFFKALAILKENNIDFGAIYVVTKNSLKMPLEIFFYLNNLFPKNSFRFNPVLIYDKKRKGIAVSQKEYSDFLGKIFSEWWKNRARYGPIEPFTFLTDIIEQRKVNLSCVESGGGCADSHINIDPLGEASQCGRSSDWGILPYGNIKDKSLEDILSDPQRQALRERSKILSKNDCKGCRFWFICHGGCPLDSYSKHKNFMHKSEWCDSKRLFIEEYFEPITGTKIDECAGKSK